jgi:hypothetical protein
MLLWRKSDNGFPLRGNDGQAIHALSRKFGAGRRSDEPAGRQEEGGALHAVCTKFLKKCPCLPIYWPILNISAFYS